MHRGFPAPLLAIIASYDAIECHCCAPPENLRRIAARCN